MKQDKLLEIIKQIKTGKMTEAQALNRLKNLPFKNLGFANIDNHRELRRGAPEVIFCQGKTPVQAANIFKAMSGDGLVMATRAALEQYQAVKKINPKAVYYPIARIISNRKVVSSKTGKYIAVVTAGTSDIPVAEEAAVTAELLGARVVRLWDVGVAGIHRLLDKRETLQKAKVVVAVAGMEGALPSVVSGLVACPVIAVPTNVGYGASFGGITALLAMLNSCSPGVAVVNIDNGFGAGYLAWMIAKGKS
ncbi:nickel pincer cofactor biosynthesis protein LarB [candidate division TA06 bacterium]|uniref:Nickel pincer cofactor biosynthesis protein LarB n=1 Tax=candidate division TA06 bacterium TaxID=2250710 RepID=A0A933I7T1_UNCT6|nr:nickel pincer cofactor biosynthesis protein LarB [candidate division TA06 bacterium]